MAVQSGPVKCLMGSYFHKLILNWNRTEDFICRGSNFCLKDFKRNVRCACHEGAWGEDVLLQAFFALGGRLMWVMEVTLMFYLLRNHADDVHLNFSGFID